MEGGEFRERAVEENVALAVVLAQRSLEELRIGADIMAELSNIPADLSEEELSAQLMVSAISYLLSIEDIGTPDAETDDAHNASLAAQFSAQTGMVISPQDVSNAYQTIWANYDPLFDAMCRNLLAAGLEVAQNLAGERGIPVSEVIADDELYVRVQRETIKVDQVTALTAVAVKKLERVGTLNCIAEYGCTLEHALRHKPIAARQVEVVERLRNDAGFQDLLDDRVRLPSEAMRQLTMYNIVKYLGQAGLDQLTVAHMEQIGLQRKMYSGTLELLEAERDKKADGQQ